MWGCCTFRVVSAFSRLLPALPSQMLVTNPGVTAHAGTHAHLGVQERKLKGHEKVVLSVLSSYPAVALCQAELALPL